MNRSTANPPAPRWRAILAGALLLLVTPSWEPVPADAAGDPPPRESTRKAIAVVAHADCRGELKPCHCPGDPSGGLSRRSALIKILRTRSEPVLLVDAGDFTPAPDDSLRRPLADLLLAAMPLMRYDAVCPGENELTLGPEFLSAAARALPLVAANLGGSAADRDAIPPLRRVSLDGVTVAVAGVLDPLLFYESPGALELDPATLVVLDPVEALRPLRSELEAADLALVLIHAPAERIREIAAAIDFVDVWVAGHEPELPSRPGTIGAAWVVEPGERSRQITVTTFDAGGGAPALRGHAVHELKRETRTDPRLDDMVRAFEAEHGLR